MASDLTDPQIDELYEAFRVYETEKGSGIVQVKDLDRLLRVIGHNSGNEDSTFIFEEMDTNENGSIDFPEFLSFVTKRQAEASESREDLIEALNCFNKSRGDFLDREVLEFVIENVGESLTKKQTQEFLQSLTYNEEGKISYDDFIRVVFNEM